MNPALSFKSCEPHPSRQPVILVVEDDYDNLVLLNCAIEVFGYQFVGQPSSKAALATAKICRPDLILLDILMPDEDGIQVLHRLRQEPAMGQIPIIAVTSLARAEDRQRLLQLGFTDYISKPYLLDDLEALIHSYLPHPTLSSLSN
jgi:CheY-like chemotaxis protein